MPRLHVTSITSIGAVESGDNPRAEILLFKKRPTETDSVVRVKPSRTANVENEEYSMERPDLTSLSEEDQAVIVKAFDEADELVNAVEEINKLEAQVTELTPTPDPIVEESDEVKAEFAKRDDKIVELEKRLAAETDTRLETEWIAKAKPLEQVLGDPDDAGPKLKNIADVVDAKVMEWLVDKLSKVANIAKQNGRIFKELGEGDAGDAADQIQALAKEAQKSNPELTDEAARLLARKANPDLKAAERDMARSN